MSQANWIICSTRPYHFAHWQIENVDLFPTAVLCRHTFAVLCDCMRMCVVTGWTKQKSIVASANWALHTNPKHTHSHMITSHYSERLFFVSVFLLVLQSVVVHSLLVIWCTLYLYLLILLKPFRNVCRRVCVHIEWICMRECVVFWH